MCCSYVTICLPTMRNPRFCALSILPLSAALKRCQVISFCFFDMPLVLNFCFFAVDKVTVRAQRYHTTAFRFEFEQSRCAPAPLIPCQPLLHCRLKFCMELRVDDVFKLVGRDGHVVAVCVHLDQLEVAAINISVQEVIVKLEHHELRQLIHRDASLEWTSDLDVWLPAF